MSDERTEVLEIVRKYTHWVASQVKFSSTGYKNKVVRPDLSDYEEPNQEIYEKIHQEMYEKVTSENTRENMKEFVRMRLAFMLKANVGDCGEIALFLALMFIKKPEVIQFYKIYTVFTIEYDHTIVALIPVYLNLEAEKLDSLSNNPACIFVDGWRNKIYEGMTAKQNPFADNVDFGKLDLYWQNIEAKEQKDICFSDSYFSNLVEESIRKADDIDQNHITTVFIPFSSISISTIEEENNIKFSVKTDSPSFFLRDSSFKSGFFNENKISQLLKKYKLSDDTQANIEKGLRNAAANNQLEDLKVFIKNVEDVNTCDKNPEKQRSALHWAAEKGNIGCLQALVEAGADVNITDSDQCTPLHLAYKHGRHDCCDYLIANGANNSLKDKNEKLPLDYCQPHIENN